jgi:hypothetical protein
VLAGDEQALCELQEQRVLVVAGQAHGGDQGVQGSEGDVHGVSGGRFGRVQGAQGDRGQPGDLGGTVLEVVDVVAEFGEVAAGVQGGHAAALAEFEEHAGDDFADVDAAAGVLPPQADHRGSGGRGRFRGVGVG